MLEANDHVTLAHGNGGRLMRELIEDLFFPAFDNPILAQAHDATILGEAIAQPVVTTDGFTVQPLEFPGGNLGSLAAHGVINDLAVGGAEPAWLTLAVILEESLPIAVLQRLASSFAQHCKLAGAKIVAGDTKVVPSGNGGGAYFAVSGIGHLRRSGLEFSAIKPGDKILVSGPVGDHGISVMLAREDFALSGSIQSDCGSVLGLCRSAWEFEGLRFLRDPTRGGLATVMHEITRATGLGIRLEQEAIPISEATSGVCDILGFDPLYLACEGRVVAIVSAEESEALLRRWHSFAEGREAAIIGAVSAQGEKVVLKTELGGTRILEELEDDPLPRIC